MAQANRNLAGALLDVAKQFRSAARLCSDHLPHATYESWVLVPEIVNYAFSAELALKGLQAFHLGAPAWGHDLEHLTRKLPSPVVDRIRGETGPALFDERRADIRATFEVWRYAHEHTTLGVSIGFLKAFSDEAMRVLQEDLSA